MARYVVTPSVAVLLAREQIEPADRHRILAPALLRSQVLSLLYQEVRTGVLTKEDASRQLDHIRGLRIRLLGDRVLQRVAWKVADQLGWPDTFTAEYVALTQLQGDALVTEDRELAEAVASLVAVVSIDALS
jgi:predicted nucleic acid-binding protein